jgi:hypothetical protein
MDEYFGRSKSRRFTEFTKRSSDRYFHRKHGYITFDHLLMYGPYGRKNAKNRGLSAQRRSQMLKPWFVILRENFFRMKGTEGFAWFNSRRKSRA